MRASTSSSSQDSIDEILASINNEIAMAGALAKQMETRRWFVCGFFAIYAVVCRMWLAHQTHHKHRHITGHDVLMALYSSAFVAISESI